MTKRQLRRAFLHDLIEEARARQDLLRGSPAENSAIDENEALAAALLAPVQVRVGLIDDLIESHEPVGFFPTSDFGPGSDFVPDWAVDSESDVEECGQDLKGRAEVPESLVPSSAEETASKTGQGLPFTSLPTAWGGVLPGLAMGSNLLKLGKVVADERSVSGAESSDRPAVCLDWRYLGLPDIAPAIQKAASDAHNFPDEHVQDTAAKRRSGPSCAKPWVVYKDNGVPCAHWERNSPPLAWNYADMVRLGYLCPNAVPVGSDIADVVEWLRDFGSCENLASPIQLRFDWRAGGNMSDPSKLHSVGRWYRFDFRQPRPAPLDGTDMSSPTKWCHPWGDYRRCIHSTNFYVLPQILRHGLQPGPNLGRGTVRGVYCYEMVGEALAVKSSGYCLYISPQNDGTFWGPRLELQVARGYKKTIGVGAKQLAACEGSYSVTALWVHLVTQEELRLVEQSPVKLFYTVDAWRPEFVVTE